MKFYLTTAIAYVNAPPHMGHVLQFVRADVLARYYRLKGKDVFFLTGADEYGSKIYKTAIREKISPQKLVARNVAKFKELGKLLNISYDDFIRTTDRKRHWPGAQLVWKKLKESGDLYKSKYQGYYCSGCEAYLTEKELVNGKCVYHGVEPEFLDEENYFFRLSKYSSKISKIIKSKKLEVIPASRAKEALNIIGGGLKDVSFSRPKNILPWGIPVPGDNKQVIYVWCDALTNYISALGYGRARYIDISKFHKYWPADLHIIGKDNLRFHVIYWPAMLMSAGLPLPKKIYVHGFITSGGKKMSKTLGNIVEPFGIIKKYGADALRYFLLREIPSFKDGDFTEEKFRERYNGELANGLGNFVARVLSLAFRTRTSDVPTCDVPNINGNNFRTSNVQKFKIEPIVSQKIKQTKKAIDKNLPEFRFSEALAAIWDLISFGDKYINQNKPWEKGDKKRELKNKKTIRNLVAILSAVAELLNPFLPGTAKKIIRSVKILHKTPPPLFPRLN